MNNQELIKKVIAGLLVLALVIIAVVYVYPMLKKDEVVEVTPPEEVFKPVTTQTQVPVDQVPDQFPENVPIEAGAAITQNYNVKDVDGSTQATRAFISKNTMAANLSLYKAWLTANNWEINATVDTPAYKMISGTKPKQELQVSISENVANKEITVTVSLKMFPQ